MRVLINDGLSTLGQYTGIGQHTINLWKHLSKLTKCDLSDYSYLRGVPRVLRRLCYLVIVNGECALQRYDVVHYQNYYVPFARGKGKKIVTIQDVITFLHPELHPRAYVHYHRTVVRNAIKRADAVVVPMDTIRTQMLSVFPFLLPEKLFVIPNGLRDDFLQTGASEDDVRKFAIEPYSYFLYVGVLSRRKNLHFLLEAFLSAKSKSAVNKETRLVLVGKRDFGYDEIKGLIQEQQGIVELGHLPDRSVVALYRFAKALVLPSLYEGFGMPIIEAMSQRVPIIVSNIPTSLEIHRLYNEQLFIFNLGDEQSLIELLSHVGRNFKTIRSRLQYGDLTRYSYDSVAREHLEVYRRILLNGS